MMIVNKLEQQKNNAIATHQRPNNIERIAQWRDVATRIGNARLINTVDILEQLYANEANEAARPPAPTLKGGAQ
jgi:hypothetical protein